MASRIAMLKHQMIINSLYIYSIGSKNSEKSKYFFSIVTNFNETSMG